MSLKLGVSEDWARRSERVTSWETEFRNSSEAEQQAQPFSSSTMPSGMDEEVGVEEDGRIILASTFTSATSFTTTPTLRSFLLERIR